MGTLVRRDRLLATLGLRHELTLCGLVAPAGFGRTVILDQAAGELGHEAIDIRYNCSPGDARPGAARFPSREPADRGVGTLEPAITVSTMSPVRRRSCRRRLTACDRRRPTALCLDRFELAGDAGTELLRLLVAGAPPGVHIVVSARRLGHVGLGRLVVSGKGCLLGWRDLAFDAAELALLGAQQEATAFRADEPAMWPALAFLQAKGAPELITGYLQDEVLADEPPAVVRALAALAAIGGCTSDDLADATAPVLEGLQSIVRDDVLDRLAELPLVGRGPIGCWPHPVWARATRSTLDEHERRLVIDGRIATLLDRGAVSEAGRMAVEVAGPDALRAVVRSALATMPVSASTHDLRAWQRSELLGADLPERMWLDAVVHSSEEDEPTRFARLEDVRKAFQAQDDVDGELSVLLHQGSLARAQGDFDSLVALLSRGEVLAARGDERARSLVALGQAIAAQLAGRPDDAVRAVDSVTTNSLPVDWVAQALMIRGVNLLLSGRLEAAIASLEAATGEGSEGSLATAHDLLSTARWQAGIPSVRWMMLRSPCPMRRVSGPPLGCSFHRHGWPACSPPQAGPVRRTPFSRWSTVAVHCCRAKVRH